MVSGVWPFGFKPSLSSAQPLTSQFTSAMMDSTYSISSFVGFVSSKRRLQTAAEFARDAEVQADGFGVADVQIAVRFGRKTRVNLWIFSLGNVRGNDVADEIGRRGRGGFFAFQTHKMLRSITKGLADVQSPAGVDSTWHFLYFCLMEKIPALKKVVHALVPMVLGLNLAVAADEVTRLPEVPTSIQPVTNVYHGVAVVEDYQWLENSTNPAVRDWTSQQNKRTRTYFDKLDFYSGVEQELWDLFADQSTAYYLSAYRHGTIFALQYKPLAQQPVLLRMKSVYRPILSKVVFDPMSGTRTARPRWIGPCLLRMENWWQSVSPRMAARMAWCISSNRKRAGHCRTSFHAHNIRPPAAAPPGTPMAPEFFIPVTQARVSGPDADLHFFQQIWFHKLGTPVSADTYELGRDFPRIAEIELNASEDGKWLLATVANGDGGDFACICVTPAVPGISLRRTKTASSQRGSVAMRICICFQKRMHRAEKS